MKTISVRQFAAIKRVAQNVNFAVTKKNKIAEKIKELKEEYESLVAEIEGHEMGVLALTGHTSEELVTKVIETTDKVDKDGRPIKVTKYEPKEGAVVFDEENKVYIVCIPKGEGCSSISQEEDFHTTQGELFSSTPEVEMNKDTDIVRDCKPSEELIMH